MGGHFAEGRTLSQILVSIDFRLETASRCPKSSLRPGSPATSCGLHPHPEPHVLAASLWAATAFGGSSNGRTADSDSVNLGSNPSPPANTKSRASCISGDIAGPVNRTNWKGQPHRTGAKNWKGEGTPQGASVFCDGAGWRAPSPPTPHPSGERPRHAGVFAFGACSLTSRAVANYFRGAWFPSSQAHASGTSQASTRTHALVSQLETGKITVSAFPVAAGCHRTRACQKHVRRERVQSRARPNWHGRLPGESLTGIQWR